MSAVWTRIPNYSKKSVSSSKLQLGSKSPESKRCLNFVRSEKWRLGSVDRMQLITIFRKNGYSEMSMFSNMLLSSARSNLKAVAQWWFSKTEESLYLIASLDFEFDSNKLFREVWSMSCINPAKMKAALDTSSKYFD